MKAPLYLPDLQAPCDQCDSLTGTKILFMRAGLGNACSRCGRFRKGKPYLSKDEFKALEPNMVKGDMHVYETDPSS